MLSVNMQIDVILIVIILSVNMQNDVMLNVSALYAECLRYALYTEWYHTECFYA